MSESKRTFIGIPLSNTLVNIIPMVRTMIEDPEKYIRWVFGKNIHLTLSFLGDIDEDKIPNLINDIQQQLQNESFTLSIEGTGIFPSQDNPRIFWLDIRKGNSDLIQLHEILSSIVKPYTKEGKRSNFMPHITIARVNKNIKSLKVDCNPFLNTVYSPVEIDINSIYLYESQLTPERAVYTELAEFPLKNKDRNLK